jgi:hypothetical protein
VDGTGSGMCRMAGFGISGVEPWGSVVCQSRVRPIDQMYEGRLQSSRTHFITPSRNFVEVR